jgi:nicotinate dehydrogenase subunit B
MKPQHLNPDTGIARNDASQPSRREVLALAGAGLYLFFPVQPMAALQGPGQFRGMQGGTVDFNTYLRIAPDGRVTCFTGKIEMGQGNMSGLAQLLAEELDVVYDSVEMVMGDTDLCPFDSGTYGSLSIRQFGPVLRGAGAEARAVLLQMAAEQLHSPVERLQVKAGVVTDPSAPSKRVTYAQLVQGKRIERHLQNVPLKPVKAFTVVGQSPRRKDALDKVTGKAKYSGDYLPVGVLHARVLRPPAREATLKSVDISAAERVPGVRVVREGDLIAVLHERRDVADQALGLIKAQFDRPQPAVDEKTIFDHILKTAPQLRTVAESGTLAEGEKLAATVFEETYLNSYVAHAAMETHSATAAIENGKATLWASTQTPFPLKQQVAQALGFTQENVRVITPYVGGGFGGKSAGGQALEAARLAKITGKPVQVVWDRAEEFFYDTFRPAAVIKIRSGVSGAGKLVLWDFKVYGAGDREAKQFYDIPHQKTVSAGGWMGGNPAGMNPVDVGAWRAPSVNSNTFARESHIDALAARLRVDPVEFRLNNLTDKRIRRVLETVVKQFGWKPGRAPSGRGLGVACATDAGSFVATIAEVAVDKSTGHVQVKRVVCAQDQGVVVSDDSSRQQMEGCITMGLGYALGEEVRFRGSEVLDHNFDTYSIPRFSWVPKIETILIQNPDSPASGCGEPSIAPMGAVVANAIYDAVGARLLQLPMTPARVLEALKRGV